MIKVVTTDSASGAALCFAKGRIDAHGRLCEWLIRAGGEDIWEENGLVAINTYTEKVSSPLRRRIGDYYEQIGLSRYTGDVT